MRGAVKRLTQCESVSGVARGGQVGQVPSGAKGGVRKIRITIIDYF